MSAAKLVPIPQAAAAQAVAEPLAGATQAIVKAATTPILKRKTVKRWDPDEERWVPETRETEGNLTAIGVLVGGLLALGALAVGQRAIRTGTVGIEEQPKMITIDNPAHEDWVQAGQAGGNYEPGARGAAQRRQALADRGPEPPKKIKVPDPSGAKRKRPVLRTRDSIADYQPWFKI